MMYMREPRGDVPVTRIPAATGVAITVCVLLTLYLGVLPGSVLNFSARSADRLVAPAAPSAVALPPVRSGQ
jgi:NADH:ubiquinone oxidoreductase subunit 2 (subunit N)